jgi:hypothetical protein
VVALVASFGVWLKVDGKRVMTAPWAHVGYLPVFNNVLPSRLMLFAVLAVAIAVASWVSTSTTWLRFVLPALAFVSLIPNPASASFRTRAYVPQFFRGDAVRRCVTARETVLTFPQAKQGDAMLWQAVSDYRFRLADGYVTPDPPESFFTSPAAARIALGEQVTWRDLSVFARDKHVTTVLVDAHDAARWQALLHPLAPPRTVGGILVYRFDRSVRC